MSIYALVDPVTNEVRYVGQTSGSLGARLSNHIASMDACPVRRGDWLRGLKVRGLAPRIELLEIVDGASANAAEGRYIASYREAGHDLTNSAQPVPYSTEGRIKATWVYIAARVPPEMHAQIRAVAREEGASMAHLIFWLVRDGLAARTQAAAARQVGGEEEEGR